MHQYVDSSTRLLDVLAKASLFLTIVWMGSIFIRKRSAAAQHRWWTLGFVGCLFVPVVSFVAPTWTPPLIPTRVQIGGAPNDGMTTGSVRTELTAEDSNGAGFLVGVTHRRDAVPRTTQTMSRTARPSSDEIQDNLGQTPNVGSDVGRARLGTAFLSTAVEFSRSRMLTILWGIGAGIVLLRSVSQHWSLNRMLRRCTKLVDTDWAALLRETAQMLGVHGKVELLEHKAAHSPVSAGVWHPVVILPSDAKNWSGERRRLVLLHELAHVARRDVLSQTVARLGCALHWFNPLAWYGLLQMRKLRETACDDLVLSCGQQPAGYADVLLDIARSYRHQINATAVGMAHSNNVESRIMAILDTTRRHVSLSRTAARALFAIAAALVCLVGTARFRAQAETPTAAAKKETEHAEKANESADVNLRDMRIRILDDEGKPLEGAMLTVGVWYPKNYDGYRTPKQHTATRRPN
ncbi:MAG: M56 family metallopeptidase [Planctomycetales bacterium]|nr:M56 family metallopeptidase [Planctomycetales bacterium]